MAEPTCKTCPHWDTSNFSEDTDGYCLRFPPVVVVLGGVLCTESPQTHDDFYCGEHPERKRAANAITVNIAGAPIDFAAIFDRVASRHMKAATHNAKGSDFIMCPDCGRTYHKSQPHYVGCNG